MPCKSILRLAAVSLILCAASPTTGIAQMKPLSEAETRELQQYEARELHKRAEELRANRKVEEALAPAKRALELREKSLPANHPDLAASHRLVGRLYFAAGHLAEAEPHLKRALEIRQQGSQPTREVAQSLSDLGSLYRKLARYPEAEAFYTQELGLREVLQEGFSVVIGTMTDLSAVLVAQGKYSGAGTLYQKVVQTIEKRPANRNAITSTQDARTLNALAKLYLSHEKLAEAETLYKVSLEVTENVTSIPLGAGGSIKLGGDSYYVAADPLAALARIYHVQGRFNDAEPLYKRAFDLRSQIGGENKRCRSDERCRRSEELTDARLSSELGELYYELGQYAEAEHRLMRALQVRERWHPKGDLSAARVQSQLGRLYMAQDRLTDAEPMLRRSLEAEQRDPNGSRASLAHSLTDLGFFYVAQGKPIEAEPLFKRALELFESTLPPDHPSVAAGVGNLGFLKLVQQDLVGAYGLLARSTNLSIRGRQRAASLTQDEEPIARRASRAVKLGGVHFYDLIRTAYQLAQSDIVRGHDLAAEAFVAAQRAKNSEVAAWLSQMAVRSAGRDPALAPLTRERQDLGLEWRQRDKELVNVSAVAADQRNTEHERQLRARLSSIDARIATIDRELAKGFPSFASLANPEPLTVPEVQSLLQDDEALLLLLDVPARRPLAEQSFVWAITKKQLRLIRSDLGTKALLQLGTALRCGLDQTLWATDSSINCPDLLKREPSTEIIDGRTIHVLPFDTNAAHEIYLALLAPLEDLIKDKHLVTVSSGALAGLPLGVLTVEAPKVVSEGSRGMPLAALEAGGLSADRLAGAAAADQCAALGGKLECSAPARP